jgi:anthranilate synthase component 1
MDMALGLRTMVIPTANSDSLYAYSGTNSRREWTIHLQVRRGGS